MRRVLGIFRFLTKLIIMQKQYSLCIVAIFGHFQNALIFRILAVFRAFLCVEQL